MGSGFDGGKTKRLAAGLLGGEAARLDLRTLIDTTTNTGYHPLTFCLFCTVLTSHVETSIHYGVTGKGETPHHLGTWPGSLASYQEH